MRSTFRFISIFSVIAATWGVTACGDDTTGGTADTGPVDALLFPDTLGLDTIQPTDTLTGADVLPDTAEGDTLSPIDTQEPPADTTVADAADTAVAEDTVAPVDTAVAADTAGPTDTWNPGCVPVPFTPPGPTSDWDHGIQTPITRAFGDANHRGQDVIVKVGEPQLLIGKFAYGFTDKDLKEEMVDIFVQRDPPCGSWEQLGEFRTSTDGQYGTQFGVEDDGGRVFFAIPTEKALPVGRYPIRMLVRGDHSEASFDLIVVPAGTSTIVFDIDGTLTTGDSQLIMELAQEIFNNTYDEEIRAAALETTWALFDKGYLIVYLTGRPDFLRPMTERWLEAHGFPPGPLHLTDNNGQVLPTEGGVGTYKTEFLSKLLGAGIGLDLYAGYGNATTDIYAYGNISLDKARTYILGSHGGEEGTVALGDDYQAHLPTAQAAPAPTVPAPPAENGWW